MIEFAMLPQQFQVDEAIAVGAENYLAGVAVLSNMMRNVDHDPARQTCHVAKITELSGESASLLPNGIG
jgi:hypothetical protein